MVVNKKLRDGMDALDECAERLGSGLYNKLALAIKNASDGITDAEEQARFFMAIDLVSEMPASANTTRCHRYTHNQEFMKATVRVKAIELQDIINRDTAGMMADIWKTEMATAFIDEAAGGHPEAYVKIRYGVRSLLQAQTGMLPKIIERLNELKITPVMLFPRCMNKDPVDSDTGDGPGAIGAVTSEPRVLRWILGLEEKAAWPVSSQDVYPQWKNTLIEVANAWGGDDREINRSCRCNKCKQYRLPVRKYLKKRVREDSIWEPPVGYEDSDDDFPLIEVPECSNFPLV